MRRIAMIPARLGSKRIPHKNLRYLGGKPLLAWIVETTLKCNEFDDVIVNSEADEILQLAERLGVNTYRRSPELAADGATSEHFIRDFLLNESCDELFQILPTSPFLSVDDILKAVRLMDEGAETVISVKEVQAECMFGDSSVNFNQYCGMYPSQALEPVLIFCNGVFAWTRQAFLSHGCYGANSKRCFLKLSGASTIDLDSERDFELAELEVQRGLAPVKLPRYWTPTAHAETNAVQVLEHDGVDNIRATMVGFDVPCSVNLDELLVEESGEFARRVVQSPSNSATVISQMPGNGNRPHYHPDWDEWWLILEGQFRYEIGGETKHAVKGDIVRVPRGVWHCITADGFTRATRLAVSRDDVEHVYSN